MKITGALIRRDVYLYDIAACHYSILEKIGFNLTNIDKNDKTKRNIQIGKMMQDNPRLTSLLRTTTKSIVDNHLQVNKIHEEEIIIRQYDGIIVTRPLLQLPNHSIPLEFRTHFLTFISSLDRSSYLATDGIETTIKGVPYRYTKIDAYLDKLSKIEFIRGKETIFRRMQSIKDSLLNSNDVSLFCVPVGENIYKVYLKDYGELEITQQTITIMDINDIDKIRYFNFYLKPFTTSITVEFI
jgi:hypothetical protein